MLFAALFLIYVSFCFFTTEGLEFMNIFTDGGRELSKYPISIYGKDVLRVFTFVVPLVCTQYYPLMYLLGRSGNVWNVLMPFWVLLFAAPAYMFWGCGLRRYQSTGS